MEYSVIVFDTAPTGHTLRFLSFPSVLEKALAKLSGLGSRLGPMLTQVGAMMGQRPGQQEDLFGKLEGMREIITEVNNQFKDAVSPSWRPHRIKLKLGTGKDNFYLCLHL
jgi:arsenite/tail-anchored protein-transporting ATPase